MLLEAIILKDGSVGTMRVLNKLADPDLVTSAVEAVKNWRYEPTLLEWTTHRSRHHDHGELSFVLFLMTWSFDERKAGSLRFVLR